MRCVWGIIVIALGCSKAREPAPAVVQVPGDAALVATLSLDQLRTSPHWPKLEQALAAKLPLADVRKTCGIDPVRAIRSFTLTLTDDLASHRATLTVHGMSRAEVDGCAKSFAATQNRMITIGDELPVAAYREGDDAVYAAWLDGTTFAIAPADLAGKDRLVAIAKPAPLTGPLAEAVTHLRGDHALAFAFHAPAGTALAGSLAQSGIEPESGYGWIELGTTLRVEIVTRFSTPERAAAAAKQTFSGPLAKLRSTSRDREVVFTMKLDANETAQLVGQALASGT